jgi:hypothetical protein
MSSRALATRTFDTQLNKMPFEIINCCKKDFHVQYKLFRHSYGFQVLSTAHVS